MIRDLKLSDLMSLEKSATFPLENINFSNCPIKKTLLDDKRILGIFMAHSTLEISIVLESDLSKLSKGKAIRSIFNCLKREITSSGYDDAHVFINNDEHYKNILKKHFGFEDVVGAPLVIRRG